MLRYLRTFRKALVEEGAFKKYFFYAVGEILLVMIGILLALQVNNWNEERKTQALVDRIVQTLHDETIANLRNIQASLKYRQHLIDDLKGNRHVVAKFPIQNAPFDINDDRAIERFLYNMTLESLNKMPEQISVVRVGGKRYVRVAGQVARLVEESDTFKVIGKSNIQLRAAAISNHSWGLAQATNASVKMDYELIATLGQVNKLFQDYALTTDRAINILYTGDGEILAVLQDMLWQEKELKVQYEKILSLIF
jgi:hypothetical protein